jgi:DNA-binding response OmpR family regulator
MRTVLLVEPNEPLRELTQRHLAVSLSKVEVVAAPDSAQGLAVLRRATCQALVVARELPDSCALLAAAAALDHPPHMIVTTAGHATPAEMERCPPATWLLKPYRMEELADCVALALRTALRAR